MPGARAPPQQVSRSGRARHAATITPAKAPARKGTPGHLRGPKCSSPPLGRPVGGEGLATTLHGPLTGTPESNLL